MNKMDGIGAVAVSSAITRYVYKYLNGVSFKDPYTPTISKEDGSLCMPQKTIKEEDRIRFFLDLSLTGTKINELGLAFPPISDYTITPIQGRDPTGGFIRNFAYFMHCVKDKTTIIVFPGTTFLTEWIDDFKFEQVSPVDLNGYTDGMKVHLGFYQVYNSIQQKLRDQYQKVQSDTEHLYLAGHSLGGALCSLASLDFADEKPSAYTYGSPRTGNKIFGRACDFKVPTRRVFNSEDIVPMLPLPITGSEVFTHVGSVPECFTLNLGTYQNNHSKAYYQHYSR